MTLFAECGINPSICIIMGKEVNFPCRYQWLEMYIQTRLCEKPCMGLVSFLTKEAFVNSVDQDQTAQNVQSDAV